MRVISQDGKFDIPYDEIVVEIFDKCVVGRLKEYIGRDIILGSYSTEAKAQKAMDMLHNSYNNFDWIKTTGFSDEIKAVCKHITKEDFKALTSPYFRFPKDEDVEVENET